MTTILILANDFSTLYNFRRELIARLIEEGSKISISIPKDNRNSKLTEMGCEIFENNLDRNSTNPLRELNLVFAYIKLLRRVTPDIVLTFTAKPNIYGGIACQIKKIPYINNVTGLGSNFQTDNLIKRIMIILQRIAYMKSDMVFFQNQSNLDYFVQKKIVKNNYKLLPGSGVNLHLHKFENYPHRENNLKFIFVSRIRKDKGFLEFFDAVEAISNSHSNIEFHLVGWYEDNNFRDLVQRMTENFHVIYHGTKTQEEVHDLISGCHCLIHPSHHEGMANVILEAAATGRPVIASNIPGCKEAIIDGKTGFLFEVKNVKSLIQKLEQFIGMTYEEKVEMGYFARMIMEKDFNRDIVVDNYLNTINSIIKGGKT
jgi:glycosyltransferase involved in cell wall biosynthesis